MDKFDWDSKKKLLWLYTAFHDGRDCICATDGSFWGGVIGGGDLHETIVGIVMTHLETKILPLSTSYFAYSNSQNSPHFWEFNRLVLKTEWERRFGSGSIACSCELTSLMNNGCPSAKGGKCRSI